MSGSVIWRECFLPRPVNSSLSHLSLPPPGAIWALLWDGLHVPAVQDLRWERQGCEDRALRPSDVHFLSHGLAGTIAVSPDGSSPLKCNLQDRTRSAPPPSALRTFTSGCVAGVGGPGDRMSLLPLWDKGHGADCGRSLRPQRQQRRLLQGFLRCRGSPLTQLWRWWRWPAGRPPPNDE